MSTGLKCTVIVPLYIYPDPGKWDPLYAAVTAHSTLDFIIIVNPNSGPGSPPWWPNEDYIRELPKLKAFPNVQIVGYVATTYCKREIEDVLKDINSYAAWSTDATNPGLVVNGIFFDETPNVFSEEVESYLDTASEAVKQMEGIGGEKIVIHNPGTAVDHRLANPGPDITTVVENSYWTYQKEDFQQWLSRSPYDRDRTCYMIHSTPIERVRRFTPELRIRAAYLFVTDLKLAYYQSFGKSWELFIESMAQNL